MEVKDEFCGIFLDWDFVDKTRYGWVVKLCLLLVCLPSFPFCLYTEVAVVSSTNKKPKRRTGRDIETQTD